MKQGPMINNLIDTDKCENIISGVKNVRKPCKIEELIRIRRLKNIDNTNSDSRGVKSEPKNVICKNSSGFSSPDSLNSCSSSSSECMTRVRGSKERVDLLEIGIIGYEDRRARMKRMKTRVKSGPKVCRRIRPRSAPSSSRFFGSECVERDSFCYSGVTDEGSDFVDCKIIERECIVPDLRKDIPEDFEPLGNPALISLMKESIDKLQAAGIKGKKSIDDIVNENSGDEIFENNETEGDKRNGILEMRINEEEKDMEEKENPNLNLGAVGKVLPSFACGGSKDIGKCRRYETEGRVSTVVKDLENIYEPRQRCSCRSRDSMRKSNSAFKYAESFNGSVSWTPRSRDFLETNGTRNSPKKLNGSFVRSCCCRSDDPLESRCRFKTRDRRSSSSPRRKVTFRLPSLVIPEEEEKDDDNDDDDDNEDEKDKTNQKNITPVKIFDCFRNKIKKFEEGEGEKDTARKSDTMTLTSTCCCCNIHRAQFRRDRRHHRCLRCLQNLKNYEDDNRKSFVPKGLNFCKEIINKHQDIIGENLQNSDSKTSVTSAKDWAVDTDDYFDYSKIRNSVYFPKETRRAMNVLLQNRDHRPKEHPSTRITVEESPHERKTQRNDRQQQQRYFREANMLKKPDLEIFNIEEGKNKAMVDNYVRCMLFTQISM